ncbi:hypothetical protein D8B26_005048 [Coccidioides posadasii str. Silveira]|uniref:uncharacterized protein n=1 Tax=Coccidioides posadasii (strain RMSCC 757 / Silveira) TaxID=443226 RepID=UPI001BF18721|nr:hypothetical protein D8B26_005048 [Coccidioides posadasii str. Silveira]
MSNHSNPPPDYAALNVGKPFRYDAGESFAAQDVQIILIDCKKSMVRKAILSSKKECGGPIQFDLGPVEFHQ